MEEEGNAAAVCLSQYMRERLYALRAGSTGWVHLIGSETSREKEKDLNYMYAEYTKHFVCSKSNIQLHLPKERFGFHFCIDKQCQTEVNWAYLATDSEGPSSSIHNKSMFSLNFKS